ncbi:MAG: HTH domain-containing protein [Verrucomicrobia bacterium]|nr:HTH domain-containing protein [Verrucomicrobiota bacterium]
MQRLNPNPQRGISRYSTLSGRIANLLNIFGDGRPHKAAELAQAIGVNSRTIRRTLHMMRDEIGIPLESSREGFHLTAPIENFITSNTIAPMASSVENTSPPAPLRFWQNATPLRN